MKAIVISHAGGPEVLEYKDFETPKVVPGKLYSLQPRSITVCGGSLIVLEVE